MKNIGVRNAENVTELGRLLQRRYSEQWNSNMTIKFSKSVLIITCYADDSNYKPHLPICCSDRRRNHRGNCSYEENLYNTPTATTTSISNTSPSKRTVYHCLRIFCDVFYCVIIVCLLTN